MKFAPRDERDDFAEMLENAISYGWRRYFKHRSDEPEMPLGAFAEITVHAMNLIDEHIVWSKADGEGDEAGDE